MRIKLRGKAVRADIWCASTTEVLRELDPARILATAERAHAGRLRLPADRTRFLAGRALLRHALTVAAGNATPPSGWRFRAGPHGKPMMDEGLACIEFNISHSGGCVAVATNTGGPVGIDIESIAPDNEGEIVFDVLTERECDLLRRFEPGRRWAEFIRLWTVKEACAKAFGLGASIDFRALEVDLRPLRVRVRGDLPASFATLSIATDVIWRSACPYRLSLAELS